MFKEIGKISAKDVQNGFKITEKCYLDKYQGEDTQKSWQDYLIEDKNFHKDLPPAEVWTLRESLEKANPQELAKASFIPLKEALDLSGYSTLVSSGIKSKLYQGYKLPQTIFEQIVSVEQSNKRQEQYGGLFETDLPEEVLPGDAYKESSIGEKRVFIANKKFGRMLALDMELIWHDQQNEILRKAQTLGRGARLFQEKTVINYLIDKDDNGYRTSSAATGGALYSTGQKNLLTTALSATQLEVAIQAMRNQTDDKGNPMLLLPDTILGPLELEGDFHRIMKAQGRTGVANQNQDEYNYLREQFGGSWKILTSQFFSIDDANDWYMMSRAMGSLIYQEVLPLTVLEEMNGSSISFERDIKRFKVMLYFGIGTLDFRAHFANRVS
jgi:hypothetical protein